MRGVFIMSVSVYISNNYINVVSGSKTKNSLTIKSCVKVPIQEGLIINGVIMNEDNLAAAVKNVWSDNPELAKSVKLVVSSTSVLSKKLNVPAVGDKKLLDIIKDEYSEVENYQKLIYDYRVLDPKAKDGGMIVMACAVEREFIEGYINLFDKCSIKLESITTAVSSLINAVSYFENFSHATYVITNLDGNNLSNTLFVNGEYNYSSRSRLLEEIGSEDSENELYRNLSSLIQFNKSQKTGFDITDIYFTGDLNEGVYDFSERLSQALGVRVSPLDPPKSVRGVDKGLFNKLFYTMGNL